MNQAIRFPLILAVICCAVAVGVGGVFVMARERIEIRENERRDTALRDIFGDDARTEPVGEVDDPLKAIYRVFGADGETIGYVTIGIAQGYGSRIRALVGIAPELDRIVDVSVLYQNETPGLGARIEEVETKTTWFRLITGRAEKDEDMTPWFPKQFRKYPIENGRLKMDTGGRLIAETARVDAITGATISSNAVIEAVRDAAARIWKSVKVDDNG